jgi:hypothetical protein
MALVRPTAANGRVAMALFLLGGLAFLFTGSEDLFGAVAVSGTASLFLAPVVIFSIWLNRDAAPWAFAVAFATALTGAALYFLETGGHLDIIEPLTGIAHKYAKLLVISVTVLGIGCAAFLLGLRPRDARREAS